MFPSEQDIQTEVYISRYYTRSRRTSIQKYNVDMFLLHVLFRTAWLLLLRLFAARAIELSQFVNCSHRAKMSCMLCSHYQDSSRASSSSHAIFSIKLACIYLLLLLKTCSKQARPNVDLFPLGDVYSAFNARVCLAVVYAQRVRSKLLHVYSLLEHAHCACWRQRSANM